MKTSSIVTHYVAPGHHFEDLDWEFGTDSFPEQLIHCLRYLEPQRMVIGQAVQCH